MNQSDASFNEQKLALRTNIGNINKYKKSHEYEPTTYTKNIITYGAPGSGKSFIGSILVLYCLSQGLNTIPTSLMIRANSLGGIHKHKLFCLPHQNYLSRNPFCWTEKSLETIRRKTLI